MNVTPDDTSPDSSTDPEKVREFSEIVSGQRRRVLPLGSLNKETLSRGVGSLECAHRWVAPVEVADEPFIFLRLPSTAKAHELRAEDLHLIPYGWDSSFGAALTISVIHKKIGWLGRAYIRHNEPLIESFSIPRCGIVLVKGSAPVLVVGFDFQTSNRLESIYEESWRRAKTHEGSLQDDTALFWDVAKNMRNVIGGIGTQPADLLSLGWIVRYASVVHEARRVLAGVAHMPTPVWPSASTVPKLYANLIRLLVEKPTPTPAELMDFARGAAERSSEELVALMLEDYHRFVHAVVGEHSPLCPLARAVFDLHVWSSASTLAGRRVPKLRNGSIAYLDLKPNDFPETCSPNDYWARVLRLPTEWSPLVQGGDCPVNLNEGSPVWASIPRTTDQETAVDTAVALIEEALSERKWTIPPDALLDLPYGPFSHMQLAECGGTIDFVLRTPTGEFSAGGMNLSTRHMWWEAIGSFDNDEERAGPIASGLYILVAAAVRDFLVVEERERVFSYNNVRKKFRPVPRNSDEPRVVYLPRVRYLSAPNVARCAVELGQTQQRHRAHKVQAHLRRCGEPSPTQLFLAQRYGMSVPQGYTFVRPHERGRQRRDVIYRSRSALRCLYNASASAVGDSNEPGGSGTAAPWFQFERDVYRLMDRMGFSVEHVAASKKGDQGVDIYASKGVDLDQACWIIQCKCYSIQRTVGPHIVRELLGTLAEYPRGVRGMIVTTSKFSRDAIDLAQKHGIRLMNGTEFQSLLARLA